ncbi:MAG TPA: LssY C-terminal domain-containing protein [Candidatus Paceibacterota bacterium]|jgi:hypothetical protein|nr:LssY C-terminal domain-containing protein [Candidatus Paceibacterota bacterium]
MNSLIRLAERILIFAIGIFAIWAIVTQIYMPIHREVARGWAIALTYFVAAYIFIPLLIRITVAILRRKHIPRFTFTADGLPADPVFMVLHGTEKELRRAFREAGWTEADPLSWKSGAKMVITFLANRPYPEAPFSSLYLFGRRQDYGFQRSIGNSPRKRHHVRFWAANIDPQEATDIKYWTQKHVIDSSKPLYWVGAGTEETGFGFARLTYQVAHAARMHIDAEREFIFSSLKVAGWVSREEYFDPGHPIIGKFISDGKILVADLASSAPQMRAVPMPQEARR